MPLSCLELSTGQGIIRESLTDGWLLKNLDRDTNSLERGKEQHVEANSTNVYPSERCEP